MRTILSTAPTGCGYLRNCGAYPQNVVVSASDVPKRSRMREIRPVSAVVSGCFSRTSPKHLKNKTKNLVPFSVKIGLGIGSLRSPQMLLAGQANFDENSVKKPLTIYAQIRHLVGAEGVTTRYSGAPRAIGTEKDQPPLRCSAEAAMLGEPFPSLKNAARSQRRSINETLGMRQPK